MYILFIMLSLTVQSTVFNQAGGVAKHPSWVSMHVVCAVHTCTLLCTCNNVIHFMYPQRHAQQICRFDCGISQRTNVLEHCRVTTTTYLQCASCPREISSCHLLEIKPSRCGRSQQGQWMILTIVLSVVCVWLWWGFVNCLLYIEYP